jgi:N-acyl-D-amino-acid deacylase
MTQPLPQVINVMSFEIKRLSVFAALLLVLSAGAQAADYDVILRGGTVYDGSGNSPVVTDVAIEGDRIAAIGDLANKTAKHQIDVKGMAVAPGFINMLSWAVSSLIEDGKSQGDIRQGVTLEVFGEGESWGPWNVLLKKSAKESQGDIRYPIQWTTLSEYLNFLTKKGVSTNVASFVGATTVRIHEIGFEDRAPTAEELKRMKQLVRDAMEEGALGLGSSLIYAPAFYAKTDELTELCNVVAEYDGLFTSHMRSEGNRLLESVDEIFTIMRDSGVRAEIYHLKAAGEKNWPKMDVLIERVNEARAQGMPINADMYAYTAGATGLDAAMPPWVQEGGYRAWADRLKDPDTRARVLREMRTPADDWENLMLLAGSPEKVLLIEFKNEKLKPLTGKSLAEVARIRGRSPEETAMDLVIEDGSRVGTVYFLMSEDNVRKQIKLPWVTFCSDAESSAPEGVFLKSSAHPRAYGNFARLLGRYVRDEKLISLEEAIRRLTTLPAENLRIKERGALKPEYFADVVVFDPAKIQDHATFEKPLQYSTGVVHVFVNGQHVLKDGEHTGAKPGRVVHGPGCKKS